MTVLAVKNLTVEYGEIPVLWNVNFEVPMGRMVAIVGPNGAGKSTLLKAILGLKKSRDGEVTFFDGANLESVRRRVAYVPQRDSVDWRFPATVKDVVLMGRYGHLGLFKRPKKEDHKIAMKALNTVGMAKFSERSVNDLSGGQKQRVFLARALCQEADLYFFDEPFNGVDIPTEKLMVDVFRKLVKEGKSIFVVHHDILTIREYFDWLILVNLRLVAAGPVENVLKKKFVEETYGPLLPVLDGARYLFN